MLLFGGKMGSYKNKMCINLYEHFNDWKKDVNETNKAIKRSENGKIKRIRG